MRPEGPAINSHDRKVVDAVVPIKRGPKDRQLIHRDTAGPSGLIIVLLVVFQRPDGRGYLMLVLRTFEHFFSR